MHTLGTFKPNLQNRFRHQIVKKWQNEWNNISQSQVTHRKKFCNTVKIFKFMKSIL